MTDDITVDLQDGILTVTLNRPAKRNSVTDAMYGALADAIDRSEQDPAVRVVLLRAEGELFCAGNDIADFVRVSEQIAGSDADPAGTSTGERAASGPASGPIEGMHVWRFLRGLAQSTVPIVAAVQGKAVGVGATMLLHADHVVMAEGAELITPFVDLALVPEAASTLLLPRRIGHVRSFAMFALAEPMPAADAVATGLANRVVPAEQLDEAARTVAEALAARPAGSLRATKRLMRDAAELHEVMGREIEVFSERLGSPEAREAFTAFAERRAP